MTIQTKCGYCHCPYERKNIKFFGRVRVCNNHGQMGWVSRYDNGLKKEVTVGKWRMGQYFHVVYLPSEIQ